MRVHKAAAMREVAAEIRISGPNYPVDPYSLHNVTYDASADTNSSELKSGK